MRRVILLSCFTLAAALAASAPAPVNAQAGATDISAKRKAKTKITVTKRYTGTRGYGFLPGYVPPERRPPTRDYTYPWYGWPGFYRGRWNYGGFGPCYTKTPIGPMWNCG